MLTLIFALWNGVALAATPALKAPDPIFEAVDQKREKIAITLVEWANGFEEITDIQKIPGRPEYFILQKTGEVFVYNPVERTKVLFLELKVSTRSELGLLGCTFHPKFAKGVRRFYLNRTVPKVVGNKSVIAEFDFDSKKEVRVLLEVEQPFSNHNAGQVQFGPDGFLYIGFGDGGSANDPLGMGQNKKAFLGKMLRVDVDAKPADGKTYQIPSSNPFAKSSEYAPEIFALGLRNPWRYTFSPTGDLVVADVGQNKWEEITLVTSGSNQGWNRMEGTHCFSPEKNCDQKGLTLPIFEYGREEGVSVTGGEFWLKDKKSSLFGKYLFGDFGTGRMWALDLKTKKAFSLGKISAQIVTFGKTPEGGVLVADFGSGKIFEIHAKQ